jgi:hypothetical protein
MPNLTTIEREAVILGYKNGSHVGRATARTGGDRVFHGFLWISG